jgi:AraC-like DNA-binding protein
LSDHIDKILLQKIKDRLVVGEDSSKQIAADLGFNDPAYLFRFFKRLTGMSPGDYRRSSRLPEEMR